MLKNTYKHQVFVCTVFVAKKKKKYIIIIFNTSIKYKKSTFRKLHYVLSVFSLKKQTVVRLF